MNDRLSDETFLSRFDDGSLAEFHHRGHLRLTWLLVQRNGRDGAHAATASAIRRFAAHKGQRQKYHETLTRSEGPRYPHGSIPDAPG